MKKKIFLIATICLCMLGLAACSQTDPTKADYNGHTYDELKDINQGMVQSLVSLTEEDKAYLLSGAGGTDEMIVDLINSWDEVTGEYGSFVEFGDFTVTKSGKTLTAEQTIQLTDRQAILTYVYTYYNMEVEGITFDAVYSLGETMGKAGLNTIMGILIVFAVLILISLIISGFKVFSKIEKKPENPAKDAESAVVTQIAQREEQTDDTELIAVIAAAIAAAEGTSTDGFVVRSIRRR